MITLGELTKGRPICYGVLKPGPRQENGVPLVRVTDINTDVLLEKNLYKISSKLSSEFKRSILRGGEVLLSIQGTVGRAAICPPSLKGANVSRTIAVIDPDERIVNSFLRYWLLGQDGKFPISGSTRASLNISDIRNLLVPLPPLPEQKRIVAILDEAFAGIGTAIANAEKNLTNTKELFNTFLNTAIGNLKGLCPEVQVQDACESITDCVNKTAPESNCPTPFKMIRTTNVRNGSISLEKVKFVNEETYKVWTRRQVPKVGDVVLTREAPMGEVGMLESLDKVFLGQRLVSYRVDSNKMTNHFLLYAFQSSAIQSQIKALASGSTVQHMRVPDTKKLIFPLPSLQVQKEITCKLDAVREGARALEEIYHQKLRSLNELKQSLLQKAFSGELTAKQVEKEAEAAIP